MREIKFRAWHKPTQLMDDVVLIDFYNEQIGILYADPVMQCESIQRYNFSEVEIMQYTGLNDKNGKEIYEGDIIEKTYYSYHQPECSELFEIKYEGLSFHFEHIKGSTFHLPFTEDIEIIGNIHDNPELVVD